MQARMDALVAEIARTVDFKLLSRDPDFADLWQPNRTHLLLTFLKRCDVARTEKWTGSVLWLPSRNLERKFGVKGHVIPDEVERTERPIGFDTLADNFSEALQANRDLVDEATAHVVRRFAMYEMGVLAYRGKRDGLCQFRRVLDNPRSSG